MPTAPTKEVDIVTIFQRLFDLQSEISCHINQLNLATFDHYHDHELGLWPRDKDSDCYSEINQRSQIFKLTRLVFHCFVLLRRIVGARPIDPNHRVEACVLFLQCLRGMKIFVARFKDLDLTASCSDDASVVEADTEDEDVNASQPDVSMLSHPTSQDDNQSVHGNGAIPPEDEPRTVAGHQRSMADQTGGSSNCE